MDARLRRGRRADARVQPDPAASAPVQHPVPRRQVLPVPGADRGGDAGRARRSCGAPSARTSATSDRTATRGPSATRSTPSPASSRSAPARTRSSTQRARAGGRASTTTSAAARGRACPRPRASPRSPTARDVDALARFPGRQHQARSSHGWTARCGRRPSARSTSRPPSSGTSSPPRAARWRPRRWCSRSPEDLDVVGVAEDDLEAAFQVFFVRGGRVLGRRGLGRGPGGGPRPAGADGVVRPPALHGADRRSRRGSWSRRRPPIATCCEAWLAARRGDPRCRSACRSAAPSAS